jgi:hypothetical protein
MLKPSQLVDILGCSQSRSVYLYFTGLLMGFPFLALLKTDSRLSIFTTLTQFLQIISENSLQSE